MSGLLQDCCNQRPSKTWLKLKNPESAAVRLGAREGVALASAHPSSAQIENPTKASTATLRMIIAIAATSMMESRLAMRQFLRQSRAMLGRMFPVLHFDPSWRVAASIGALAMRQCGQARCQLCTQYRTFSSVLSTSEKGNEQT